MSDTSAEKLRNFGQWAVISGASEGTGAEFARAFAQAGLNLVLIARRAGPLEALARSLRDEFKVDAIEMPLDLSASGAADEILRATRDLDVGIYVSNAGADERGKGFLAVPIEEWHSLVARNIGTLMTASHGFATQMRSRGRGAIIVMSSVTGFGGQAGIAVYAATKAFDLTFAEGLSSELKGTGVVVLGIAAPPMATPVMQRALAASGQTFDGLYEPADVVQQALSQLGVGASYVFDFPGVATASGADLTAARRARLAAVEVMTAGVFGET